MEVRLQDQKAINTFGRLNTRLHELREELKEKASLHDQLDDAANELILADDDEPVRCCALVGHWRVRASATRRLEARTSAARALPAEYSTASATSR